MKKGDARRQAIVDTAQRLFFDKGYENTSVQDILDEMKLSKGGFYHHFESKLQLLEAICAQHAEAACERGVRAVAAAGNDPIAQFNALFKEGGFFGEEAIKYISLMLSTAYGGELSQLRESTRVITLKTFEPVLKDILLEGMQKEVFFLVHPDSMPRLILMLAIDATDEVAGVMARSKATPGDMAEMIELMSAYRSAVEMLVGAPYGSIELIDLKRMLDVLRSISVLSGRSFIV